MLGIIIYANSEDLKAKKYYLLFNKVAIGMIAVGIIMELTGWNHLHNFECIYITAIPFLLINIIKGIMVLFQIIFNKEPFQMYRNELSDGIWIKNKGDLKNKSYYVLYSFTILIVPMILLTFAYKFIKNLTL